MSRKNNINNKENKVNKNNSNIKEKEKFNNAM